MAQQSDRWDTRCPDGDTPEGDCQSTKGTESMAPKKVWLGNAILGIEHQGSMREADCEHN